MSKTSYTCQMMDFFFIKYWTSTSQNCQDHQKKRKERNSDVMWYLGCDPGTEKKKKRHLVKKIGNVNIVWSLVSNNVSTLVH